MRSNWRLGDAIVPPPVSGGLILIWIALSLTLALRLPHVVGLRHTVSGVVAPVAFVGVTGFGLLALDVSAVRISSAARGLVVAVPGFWIVSGVLAGRWRIDWLASAVLCAAWSEEVVFRLWLPRALLRPLALGERRHGAFVATILAQCCFAAAHFMIPHGAPPSPVAMARLVACGVAFWLAMDAAGLWFAASLHGAVNMTLLDSARITVSPGVGVTLAVLVLSTVVLWARSAALPTKSSDLALQDHPILRSRHAPDHRLGRLENLGNRGGTFARRLLERLAGHTNHAT